MLPAHQGRACENVIATTFVREGDVVPMNYHFTTPKTHIVRNGGRVEELLIDEGTDVKRDFKTKEFEKYTSVEITPKSGTEYPQFNFSA